MIHKTAIISDDAKIGTNVEVGPYSVIEGKVEIGSNCRIGPHVSIYEYTNIGDGCQIHACAALGGIPQDKGFKDVESFAEIGSDCVIREGVTVHRGTGEGAVTRVGRGCFLMAYSHVAHNCNIGEDVIMANGALLAGHVTVGDKVFISGGVGVHQFVRIGRLAFIGANGACGKDVPPFCMVAPCTLNGVRGLNVVGMRRAGMGPEDRLAVKRVFKVLYGSGLNVKQALEKLDAMEGAIPAEFGQFVRASDRGIC